MAFRSSIPKPADDDAGVGETHVEPWKKVSLESGVASNRGSKSTLRASIGCTRRCGGASRLGSTPAHWAILDPLLHRWVLFFHGLMPVVAYGSCLMPYRGLGRAATTAPGNTRLPFCGMRRSTGHAMHRRVSRGKHRFVRPLLPYSRREKRHVARDQRSTRRSHRARALSPEAWGTSVVPTPRVVV